MKTKKQIKKEIQTTENELNFYNARYSHVKEEYKELVVDIGRDVILSKINALQWVLND